MNNQVLLDKLDRTTDIISRSLIQLVNLSSINCVSDNGSPETNELIDSTVTIATTGVTMVNTYTMQIIKGVQDLLVITRSIREKWVLSQFPDEEEGKERELDYAQCDKLLDECMHTIIGDNIAFI